MFDFLARLFRGEPSGAKAKERLRLVLLSDHLALAPDVIEALKTDLLEVISRYVEVDTEHVDVTFEQREHEVAMLANVPIRSMKNGRPKPAEANAPASVPAPRQIADEPPAQRGRPEEALPAPPPEEALPAPPPEEALPAPPPEEALPAPPAEEALPPTAGQAETLPGAGVDFTAGRRSRSKKRRRRRLAAGPLVQPPQQFGESATT